MRVGRHRSVALQASACQSVCAAGLRRAAASLRYFAVRVGQFVPLTRDHLVLSLLGFKNDFMAYGACVAYALLVGCCMSWTPITHPMRLSDRAALDRSPLIIKSRSTWHPRGQPKPQRLQPREEAAAYYYWGAVSSAAARPSSSSARSCPTRCSGWAAGRPSVSSSSTTRRPISPMPSYTMRQPIHRAPSAAASAQEVVLHLSRLSMHLLAIRGPLWYRSPMRPVRRRGSSRRARSMHDSVGAVAAHRLGAALASSG